MKYITKLDKHHTSNECLRKKINEIIEVIRVYPVEQKLDELDIKFDLIRKELGIK